MPVEEAEAIGQSATEMEATRFADASAAARLTAMVVAVRGARSPSTYPSTSISSPILSTSLRVPLPIVRPC